MKTYLTHERRARLDNFPGMDQLVDDFDYGRISAARIGEMTGMHAGYITLYMKQYRGIDTAGPHHRPFRLRESELPLLVALSERRISLAKFNAKVGLMGYGANSVANRLLAEHNLPSLDNSNWARRYDHDFIQPWHIPIFEAYQRREITRVLASKLSGIHEASFLEVAARNGYEREPDRPEKHGDHLDRDLIISVVTALGEGRITELEAARKIGTHVSRMLRRHDMDYDPEYRPCDEHYAVALRYRDRELTSVRAVAKACGISSTAARIMLAKLGFLRRPDEARVFINSARRCQQNEKCQELAEKVRQLMTEGVA